MKRPFLVTVISIVMIVIGLAQMGIGITVLVERNDDTFLTDADMTSSQATGFGIALLVIGTLSVLLAFGLLPREPSVARAHRPGRGVTDRLGDLRAGQAGLEPAGQCDRHDRRRADRPLLPLRHRQGEGILRPLK